MMHVSLFGNLRISVDGDPLSTINTNRLQSLLAYLILHVETPQPRDALAFTMWPASRESQARTNLRQLLHNLRRALPVNCESLVADHFAVLWRRDGSTQVDTWEFQSAVSDAAAARNDGSRMLETALLTKAAALYADDLLPALYDDWILPFRNDYRRRAGDALHRLATIFEEQGEYAAAIPYADRLLVLDPLAEAHHQLLIRLHAGNHDRASALRAYHTCMRVLRREMGVEPGPETRRLFEQILKDGKSTSREATPASAQTSRGKPFSEAQNTRSMVGRENEWSNLMLAWRAAVEDGLRVVIISGEPGIGKTRLADELSQWCSRHGHAVARCRCYAGQGQVSYSPVAELLRSDDVRAGWAKMSPHQVAELARLIPEIAPQQPVSGSSALAGLNTLPENWQRLRLYESLNAAIGSSRKPLLLYVDDMQWCDSDTLEWLGAFFASPEAAGVLMVATLRSGDTEREHPFTRFIAGLRQSDIVFEIALERLGADETAELASRESAKPLDGEKVNEIFRATRGNPLFVLESVRAGLQSQRVHAVLSARLVRLSPAAYELALLASVVGRPFSVELIEKAVDWDEGSVFDALDELWRRRILEASGTSEYDFTHDLLREAAYSELSPVRRRYLHRRLARALAEVHQTDIENWRGQIGFHFEQAGMVEAAIESFQLAAAHARQRYADSEAASVLRRALALCSKLPESDNTLQQELTLLLMLGPVLVTTEGYSAPEVGATYGRALELSRRFDHRDIFAILGGAWLFHIVRGDLEAARQCSVEFLNRAEQDPATRLLVVGNFLLGSSLFHLGDLPASLRHMEEAFRRLEGPNDPVLELFAGPDIDVFCRAYLGHLAWHCGDEDKSVSHAAEAVAVARRLRHPFGQAIALDYAAMLDVFRGESRSAFEHASQAVELCTRYGFTYYLAMGSVLLGWARAAEGDVAAGLEEIRKSLKQMRRLGVELRLPFYLKLLAETLGRAGQIREALADLSTAFGIVSKNGEIWALADLHCTEGELLAAEGRVDQAQVSYRKGHEAARESGSLAFQRKIRRLLDGTAAIRPAERF